MESGKEDLEAETKGSTKDAPQRICKKCLLQLGKHPITA